MTSVVFLFDGVGILMNMMKLLAFDGQFTAARAAALMDHLIDSIRADPEAKARGHASPHHKEEEPAMSGASRASGKDLLYTCSYVPEEIVLAAGFRPRRFLPEGRPADAWIHPNTCGYVKNVLAAALDSEDLDAVGIIIANSCDAMRRLYDLWTGYVPRVPAFFLDVPKKSDDDSIAFFASELARLSEWLHGELRGTRVTETNLGEAARTCNEIRSLMGEVFGLQAAVPSGIPGARVFDLCLAGTAATEGRLRRRHQAASGRREGRARQGPNAPHRGCGWSELRAARGGRDREGRCRCRRSRHLHRAPTLRGVSWKKLPIRSPALARQIPHQTHLRSDGGSGAADPMHEEARGRYESRRCRLLLPQVL